MHFLDSTKEVKLSKKFKVVAGTFAGLVATALAVILINRKKQPVTEEDEQEAIREAEELVREYADLVTQEEDQIKGLLGRVSSGVRHGYERYQARLIARRLAKFRDQIK